MITFDSSGGIVTIKDGFNVIRVLSENSKNISWGYGSDTTRISFTIDDITFDSVPATNISFSGTPLSSATGFKAAVEAMFPNLAGGGSSLLQTATVTLTDAQIKALPTTGVEVISALGVGKVALPIFGHIVLNIISPYVANSASSFQLMTGSPNPGEGIDVSLIMLAQNVLQSTGKGILSIGCPFSYTAVSIGGNIDGNTVSYNPGGDVYDGMTNQPVYIKDSAGQVSNYTGGNAANTLKVTVYYVVVDL